MRTAATVLAQADFLDALDPYDFLVRDGLVLVLAAVGVYLLLNAGIFAVPHVGFMAMGGYASAVASVRFDVPFAVSLLVGLATGTLAGLVLGVALMRLDGIYLAIGTIGFSEIVRVMVRNLEFTGGATGLTGIARSTSDPALVGIVGAVLLFLWRLSRTRYGLMWEAMRHDVLVTSHQGIDVARVRVALFAATGAICAVAGTLQLHLVGFIEPGRFTFEQLIELLAAAILGGISSVWGALVGGAVIFGLPELLVFLEDYRHVFNGLVILGIVVFAPQGLIGLVGGALGGLRPRRSAESAAAEVTGETAAEALATPASAARERSAQPAGGEAEPIVLRVRGISKSFGGIRAVDDVSFEVRRGEMLGLIGPNGSGKTTMLNILSGVYRPDAGEVTFAQDGAFPFGRPHDVTALGLARTFQGIRLVPERTGRDNVELGAYRQQRSSVLSVALNLPGHAREVAEARRLTDVVLDELRVTDVAGLHVDSLPYGPQRKIELARALLSRPEVLLVDEPTAGMTPTERTEIFHLLDEVRRTGTSVVVVEHDVESISGWCDRVAVLNFGKLIAVGEPDAVLREEVVVDAYLGRRSPRR